MGWWRYQVEYIILWLHTPAMKALLLLEIWRERARTMQCGLAVVMYLVKVSTMSTEVIGVIRRCIFSLQSLIVPCLLLL